MIGHTKNGRIMYFDSTPQNISGDIADNGALKHCVPGKRRETSMMEPMEGTRKRRRQSKSFKGCNACKIGKRKCSEERQRRWQCSIRKIECEVHLRNNWADV